MRARSKLPLLVACALVIALSLVLGAMAPPLHIISAAGSGALGITVSQWQGVSAGIELSLEDSDASPVYLPLITF